MSGFRRFHLPQAQGRYSRQAHVAAPYPTFERELGAEGFDGPATMMYHRNPPTAWSGIHGPLRPRAFDLTKIPPSSSPANARLVTSSAHMKQRYWVFEGDSELFRNSDGDDVLFVHKGEGVFFCDFGHLDYVRGDYIVVPRGTMWRVETKVHNEFMLIEATDSAYGLPDRGLMGPHSLFDPGVLDYPKIDAAFEAQQRGGAWTVTVKRHDELTRIDYAFNPLDAVGWQGDRTVLRLNITQFRPVVADAYHMPPSTFTTFVAERFAVCTIPPLRSQTDPRTMKIPFWHNNDDYDEIVFNHDGVPLPHPDLDEGSMTFHPSGLTHSVYPPQFEYMFEVPFEERVSYAVLIDSRASVRVAESMEDCEVRTYVNCWKDGIAYAPDAPRGETGEPLKVVGLVAQPAE
jgi:homogentisate 1,2-dioxygenase